MEAAVTIDQFGKLLQSEQEDNALLRVLRQLQSTVMPQGTDSPSSDVPQIFWGGWA